MTQTQTSHAQIRKFLPFLLIFLVVIVLIEQRKKGPLPPPEMVLIAQDIRSAENTDFTLPNLSGTPIRLADFKGNVVLLNFFATWCPPCREELPSLEELFQRYKHQNFVVLGVAGDTQGKEVVEPFIKEFGVTFPVLLDPQNRIARQYRVRGIPTIYLLDQHGRIAGMTVGGADWNSQEAKELIEKLLQER